jgi:predicted nuclease of predicted toxin-antitoxin system
LKPDILTDENVNYRIIKDLRANNYNVHSIFEESRGITDLQVLQKSVDLNALLITEDSDFGEWIFSFHKSNNGVIFLRYRFDQLEELIKKLILVLDKYNQELYNKFTVITPKKIRVRSI